MTETGTKLQPLVTGTAKSDGGQPAGGSVTRLCGGFALYLIGLCGLLAAVKYPAWPLPRLGPIDLGAPWVRALVAVIVGGWGLWWINTFVVGRWFTPSAPAHASLSRWRRKVGLIGTVFAGGVLITALAIQQQSASLTLVGLACPTLALAPLSAVAGVAARRWLTLNCIVAALLVGSGGLVMVERWASGSQPFVGGLVPIGLVLTLVGLGLAKVGTAVAAERATRWIVLGGLVLFVAGVLSMGQGVRSSSLLPGLLGSVLIFFALTVLALAWPRPELWPFGGRTVAVVALLFVLGAVFVLWSTGLGDVQAWGLSLGIAVFGWSIVKKGEGVLLAVGVGLVVIWSLVDRTVPPGVGLDPYPDASLRIVAFGDSYMSGEGAPRYFAGTNQLGDDRNECRRTNTAYPYRVAQQLKMGLDFYACSGAKARDIIGDDLLAPATIAERDDSKLAAARCGPAKGERSGCEGQMPDSAAGVAGADVQIANLPEHRESIAVALVSIGGNDVRFSQVATGCLLPGTCDELRQLWLKNVETLGPRLRKVYQEIHHELPGVPIIALPYPEILAEGDCSGDSRTADTHNEDQLNPDEHEFVHEFLALLDQQIRVSAAQEDVHFFEDGMFAFNESRICDVPNDKAAVNFISLAPPGGPFLDRLNPTKWHHNSLHPKPDAHGLTASALSGFICEVLAHPKPSDTVRPELPEGCAGTDPRAGGGAQSTGPVTQLQIGALRGATPLPTRPEDWNEGVQACGLGMPPDAFGSRALVIDEAGEDGDDTGASVPAVQISDAPLDGTVCIKDAMGSTWEKVVLQDGYIQPETPARGFRKDVLYADRSGVVRYRALDFCSRLAGCNSSFESWNTRQLTRTARSTAPAVVMALLGGWLLAQTVEVRDIWRFLGNGGPGRVARRVRDRWHPPPPAAPVG